MNTEIAPGSQFGQLTVLSFCGINKYRHKLWLCKCACGTIKNISGAALRAGTTVACGCKQGEHHGLWKSPEYKVWDSARERCHNPNNASYKNYGGRGIQMCDEWRNSFATFIRDMGPRPSSKYSIDRIDNNGPYSPNNCRWATISQQARNTRSNRYVTIDGVCKCVSEWAFIFGLPPTLVFGRIRKGWNPEIALKTPRRGLRHVG